MSSHPARTPLRKSSVDTKIKKQSVSLVRYSMWMEVVGTMREWEKWALPCKNTKYFITYTVATSSMQQPLID
jgi:hypothetical protein